MNNDIEIIRSKRKTAVIEVKPDGKVYVRVPARMKKADIERIISDRHDWIEKSRAKMLMRKKDENARPPFTRNELTALSDKARGVFSDKVSRYAELLGVSYGKISVKPLVSRWGSCSSGGNLCFNILLMLCEDELVDYVVVHELCHRKQMNHSDRFWKEVGRVIPDYKERKKRLQGKTALISALREADIT